MKLNLPIFDNLKDSENILIAGAGGGFDIFAGLPIYFTLKEMGKNVHLANLSFTDFTFTKLFSETAILIDDMLMGTSGKVKRDLPYFPEPYLAQWFKEERDEDVTVWMFGRSGGVPLVEAYHKLAEHLEIDAVVLVDGGVDSLSRGDEEGPGTLLEDTLSLVAADSLDIPVKIISCIGFGTEQEEKVCHYNALENMAALAKAGAFYGSCALVPDMDVFQLFESACRYVWEKPDHHKSHISTRVIPSVHGEFGNYHMYSSDQYTHVFISPLMSLYWFYDLSTVVKHNTLAETVLYTYTREETMKDGLTKIVKATKLRPRRTIPY
jgi:hypothetical protein